MDRAPSHMTEKILDLTLEIIYLLTGESFSPVKSGDFITITVPSPDAMKPKRSNIKKMLEVTKKMMKLLTGEVPIRCQNHSMEEYIERHKDVTVEDQPDGSRKRNPPQRRPRPRDSTQEDLTIPPHHQGEEQIKIKAEIKEEEVETYLGGDQPSSEDVRVTKREQDEISLPISATDGCDVRNTSERHLILSADCKSEDDVITQDSPAVNPDTQNIHHGPYCAETSMAPSDQGESSQQSSLLASSSPNEGVHSCENLFLCSVCGKSFTEHDNLLIHQRSHAGEQHFSCSECGKSFPHEIRFLVHQKSHTEERPYSCSECGRRFTCQRSLLVHIRIHTGERPYTCSECGKTFTQRSVLVKHQTVHTGERPYSCSECGKSFSQKQQVATHQRIHTGERPYSCSECGKTFIEKGALVRHHKIHTGERPFLCTECGKCFSEKEKLIRHQRFHTGERHFSCSDCSRSFTQKIDLVKHQRTHTREQLIS